MIIDSVTKERAMDSITVYDGLREAFHIQVLMAAINVVRIKRGLSELSRKDFDVPTP